MNTTRNATPHPDNLNKKIDAALRILGHTQPSGDFEQRIHARLNRESARARQHTYKDLIAKIGEFFFVQRLALTATAAALACVAIVVGSVQHSHQRILPAAGVHLVVPISGSGSGLGAASGTHISPQPVLAPQHARSRSERKAAGGRATVSRNAHKPSGVAVPESTDPQKP